MATLLKKMGKVGAHPMSVRSVALKLFAIFWISAAPALANDGRGLLETLIKCPVDNGRVFERELQNMFGDVVTQRVWFLNGEPSLVTAYVRGPEGDEARTLNSFGDEQEASLTRRRQRQLDEVMPIYKEVCEGTGEANALRMLSIAKNRERLGLKPERPGR